ncbi:hypothetical protein Ct9H90mP12_1190 [bacterium]|nr:MAG: hypothetical protein Ct9H90mP12_1190 [bacterium]
MELREGLTDASRLDNDGFIDIYIVRGGWLQEEAGKKHPNSLLRNNGDGHL